MTKGPRNFFRRSTENLTESERRLAEDIGVPFAIARPIQNTLPILAATPHSGRIYPRRWLSTLQLRVADVRRAEDALVDDLLQNIPSQGVILLRARFPRSFVDVNRERSELEKALGGTEAPTTRVNSGLGVVPTAIAQGVPLYEVLPKPQQAEARLRVFYDPYHAVLEEELSALHHHYGHAILLDMHSMPGLAGKNSRLPDFVLGDRFGKSCSPDLVSVAAESLRRMGYHVAYNHPYAGGYITRHYGRPENGQEALQIEINRDLYLNPATLKPNRGFSRLQQNLEIFIADICAYVQGRDIPMAAE